MSLITDEIIMRNSHIQGVIRSQNSNQPVYVYSDLNVRDPYVTNSTDVMLYDTKVIVQSVWRLLTTEEGEIPNFRQYGLSIKRFSQYPLNDQTINGIYEYVKGRLEAFETRAEIIKADVDVDFTTGRVYMEFYLKMRASGEVVKLPTWVVQVSTI